MDFTRRFEAHQVEQIRRAVIAYRDRRDVGDVTLANELLDLLGTNASYYATLKNIQRLRKGERITGATFLNACIKFLNLKLSPSDKQTPPEQELGFAMQRFIAPVLSGPEFWQELAGDYAVRLLRESRIAPPPSPGMAGRPMRGIPIGPRKTEGLPRSLAVVTITPREGGANAAVRERHFLSDGDQESDGEPQYSEANVLERGGVCLPTGTHDVLVMIRDFMFSHMYVLRSDEAGFIGTLILPDQFGLGGAGMAASSPSTRYDVALQKLRSG